MKVGAHCVRRVDLNGLLCGEFEYQVGNIVRKYTTPEAAPRLYKHYWPTRHRLSNSTRKGWLIGKNTSRTFSRAHRVYSFLFEFRFNKISQRKINISHIYYLHCFQKHYHERIINELVSFETACFPLKGVKTF